MSTKILTKKEVAHIGALANLKLTEKEITTFTAQLGDIIKYIQKLNELDTSDILSTSQVTSLANVTREDEVKPSLSQKEALANAKDTFEGYFKVKAVFDKRQ